MSGETQFIVTLVTIGLSLVGTIVSIVLVAILLYRLMQRYIDQRFEAFQRQIDQRFEESNRRDDELNQRIRELTQIVGDLSQRTDQRFDQSNERTDQRFDALNQRIGGMAEDVAEIKGALGVIRDAVPLRVVEQQP